MSVLDRLFGPDPNPAGDLPYLPHGGWRGDCNHDWIVATRHEVNQWTCRFCSAELSELA